MQYNISGKLIKSENTAKPYTQQSRVVLEYLHSQVDARSILDFGCGKLRYSDVIINLCNNVTFVDSKVQLSRIQTVRGEKTSVKDYVNKYHPNCEVVAFEDLDGHSKQYDLITCINVLSAIPCKKTIRTVLSHISRLLSKNGKAIFVNQHRNSYFKKYKAGKRHLYGYIYNSYNCVSYYGILNPEDMKVLLTESGFQILEAWQVGGINFVEVMNS